ncbi:efflux RND transporter periplasmic adaptor subunit [Tistrella mobilis]|uniref:efflux RND transporter periplasmic adaptor subunit n=1 Tax=Tistrella mobilis TaxID=171437 RepID=UPI0035574171
MRIIGQIILIAGLAAAGAGAWYGWDRLAGGEAGKASATVTPATVRPVTVELAAVTPRQLARVVEAVGTARAMDAVTVATKISGRIAELNFTPGTTVEAGRVLAALDDAAARANVAQLEAAVHEAQTQLERTRQLRQRNAVSAAEFDTRTTSLAGARAQLAAARAELADHKVVAPFSGRVGLRQVSIGAVVGPDTAITTLDDIDPIKLSFAVPETALAQLSAGQTVAARSAAYPDEAFTGRVQFIDTRIDVATRAVTVEAAVDNPDGRLKPGMFMAVTLTLDPGPDVPTIPETAMIREGRLAYVYVAGTDGIARRRIIEPGRRQDGLIEVLKGLEPGEPVVVAGHQRLRDGAPVTVATGTGTTGTGPQPATAG